VGSQVGLGRGAGGDRSKTLSVIQRSDGHKAEARKDKRASVHFLAVGLEKYVQEREEI
jgi:hypothetical protein